MRPTATHWLALLLGCFLAAGGSFNSFKEKPKEERARQGRSSTAPRRSSEAPAISVSSSSCESVQRQALQQERSIENLERQVEQLEDRADDIELSDRSRRNYEVRAERAQQKLDLAVDRLHDFRQRKRQQGIDWGCLR